MFSFICAWINGRVNNREADGLQRHRFHYDVIVMRSETQAGQTLVKCRFVVCMPVFWSFKTHCTDYPCGYL